MSAALYMAELKGLMLSLGQIHDSPRQLLIEANRIMAGALDSRSFITVLYAVFDLDAATLTYARAGHTPLMYASRNGGAVEVRTLTPDGLVLGLDGFESQFESLLKERRLTLCRGNLAVLFTDGVTEAMNEDDDLFGEERLQRMIEAQGRMPAEALRAHIMRDIEAFVGSANQHDDMTMVLVRIDEVGAVSTDTDAVHAAAE